MCDFLKAIEQADKNDSFIILVFADYVEELGYPDSAKFIRNNGCLKKKLYIYDCGDSSGDGDDGDGDDYDGVGNGGGGFSGGDGNYCDSVGNGEGSGECYGNGGGDDGGDGDYGYGDGGGNKSEFVSIASNYV